MSKKAISSTFLRCVVGSSQNILGEKANCNLKHAFMAFSSNENSQRQFISVLPQSRSLSNSARRSRKAEIVAISPIHLYAFSTFSWFRKRQTNINFLKLAPAKLQKKSV